MPVAYINTEACSITVLGQGKKGKKKASGVLAKNFNPKVEIWELLNLLQVKRLQLNTPLVVELMPLGIAVPEPWLE